jgi:hypothetical protein
MLKFLFGKKSNGERQRRVTTEISVNFRKVNEFSWSIGKTTNISRSGALIRSVQQLGPTTHVEVEFVAPQLFGDEAGQLVACRGKVLRTSPPPPNDRRSTMAVHFSKLAVVRRPGEW